MMAWTQLRLFASLLPEVKGLKRKSYRDQRCTFMRLPQNRVSLIFKNFQNSVLSRILSRCGFVGTLKDLPSLDSLKDLASKLSIVRSVPPNFFRIEHLSLSSNQSFNLMKNALVMKRMIDKVRFYYPEIVFFLAQNENAVKNIIMVWRNQLIVKEALYRSFYDTLETVKMNDLFVLWIIAVIYPQCIDESLNEFIENCETSNKPKPKPFNICQFLIENCKSIPEPILKNGNIQGLIEFISLMPTSITREFKVRYALKPWSMGFGKVLYYGQPAFEEVTVDLESSAPILDAFSKCWNCFFKNFSQTFQVSFLPFGNILWSERYTRLFEVDLEFMIRNVIGKYAFEIGALNDHSFFKSKTPDYLHTRINKFSYEFFIFPDGIRNAIISKDICSCFLRDFWISHQKTNPTMSDIEYIRILFSNRKESWIELMDALQNGTNLPKIDSRSKSDFTYLSFPIFPIDPKVQQIYNENFANKREQG
jgi:hypothetical protein